MAHNVPSRLRRSLTSMIAWGAVLATPSLQAADDLSDYPSKPIRLIVPFAAGGGSDTLARVLGQKLSSVLGQTVVVENKPGASGILGTEAVVRSKPDGYTILLGATPLVQLQATTSRLPYETFRDLVPLARIGLSSDVFVVPSSSGITSVKGFIDSARSSATGRSYGTYGNGTSSHMHGELLRLQTGATLTHVPFKGSGPMVQDFLGGHLDSAFPEIASIRPHLSSPKLTALAVTGERRILALPNVPTFTELGYRDFEPNGWYGVFAPSGTPRAVLDRLSAKLLEVLEAPDMAARVRELGLEPATLAPAAFLDIMRRDADIWSRVAKSANITME
jgi:tripartite-type tricarboxylate transporter receptor subunit TctC